jgi:hypothetical protein
VEKNCRDGNCERGDSNPHAFRHQILSLARLPIPPLSREAVYRRLDRFPRDSVHAGGLRATGLGRLGRPFYRLLSSRIGCCSAFKPAHSFEPVYIVAKRRLELVEQPDAEFLWFLPHRWSSPGCSYPVAARQQAPGDQPRVRSLESDNEFRTPTVHPAKDGTDGLRSRVTKLATKTLQRLPFSVKLAKISPSDYDDRKDCSRLAQRLQGFILDVPRLEGFNFG